MMKMKLLLIGVSILLIVVVAPDISLAQNASPSGVTGAKNTVRPKVTGVKQTQAEIKAQRSEKVRTSVISIYDAYSRLTLKAGQLLDKLQVRIDTAKVTGNNVTAAETAMKDARAKLADATKILENAKGKKETAMDKTTFQALRRQLQTVHKDINAVRLDAAKIISTLKSFNSANESTKSPILNKTGR